MTSIHCVQRNPNLIPNLNQDQFMPNTNLNLTTIHILPLTLTRSLDMKFQFHAPLGPRVSEKVSGHTGKGPNKKQTHRFFKRRESRSQVKRTTLSFNISSLNNFRTTICTNTFSRTHTSCPNFIQYRFSFNYRGTLVTCLWCLFTKWASQLNFDPSTLW